MSEPPRPPIDESLGVTSLVIAIIGLMLCLMPILAVPISAIALVIGIVGFIINWARKSPEVRMCLYGTALAFMGLSMDLAIWFSPSGIFPHVSMAREQPGPHERQVPPTPPPPD